MSFVYENIKKVAKEEKLSLKELAEKIGMTATGFHQMVSNDTMKLSTLFKIADVLNIDPQLLMLKDYILYTESSESELSVVKEKDAKYSTAPLEMDYLSKRIDQLKKEVAVKDELLAEQKKLLEKKDELYANIISK